MFFELCSSSFCGVLQHAQARGNQHYRAGVRSLTGHVIAALTRLPILLVTSTRPGHIALLCKSQNCCSFCCQLFYSMLSSIVLLKCDGTRRRTGGEVKRKLANAVGSQYPSHYLRTWCIQHYYRACAHLGCQQSTELTAPRRFKWTRPLRRKTKFGFCACAVTFQTYSTFRPITD